MSQFQITRGRGSVSDKPGAPERDRTRGGSDKRKGSSKPKKHQTKINDVPKAKRRKGQSEGYEGDAALRYLKKYGAKEGWVLECYPRAKSTGRWFMRVENGLVMNDDKGNIVIKSCRWLEENSLTEVAKQFKPEPCDIEWVKAYGPLQFFVLEAVGSSSKPAPTPMRPLKRPVPEALPLWVPMPTFNYSAQQFIHQKMSKSVDHVEFAVLHAALKTALVPGAFHATNKNLLIELMCKYNCEFVAHPHPMVRLANKQSSSQPAALATTAAAAVSAASSSDDDAPLAAKYADAYFVDKARESVKAVTVSALRAAMKLVPGVSTCKSKEDLIQLMVAQKFADDVPTIVSD